MLQVNSIHRSLLVALFLLTASGTSASAIPALETAHPTDSRCSVFTLAKGEQVFFGGNDDYIHPDSWYWVDPGDGVRFGVVWIGEPDNVQQGVNERGLAYDSNGLPRVDVNPHSEREPVTGSYTSYPIHILHECATVAEVIAWVETHEWHTYMHDQMQFADAGGDAVIVSAGPDGEVVFTRKPPGDGFLVSTNFNVARPSNGFGHPCWRYDRATELLEGLVGRERALAVEDAASVLDAVHVEGASSWTISSLVADLTAGEIRLYLFHQFDRPLVLDVREELAKPRAAGPLSELFPETVREEAVRRYDRIRARSGRCRRAGTLWLVLVLLSLTSLLLPGYRGGPGLRFWLPAMLLLGPLALLVRLLPGQRRGAMVEALGDVMPLVPAFVAFLALILFVPALQSDQGLQILLILLLPTLLAWAGFHGPLLSPTAKASGESFLSRRLPQVLVTINLGLAGMSIVSISLLNLSLRNCAVFPPSAWTFVTFWLVVALSSVPGLLLISLHEAWALRRGFRAWSALVAGDGSVSTIGWRGLRWWIPVSFLALAGGVVAGARLWQVLGGG
jgi:hypothetical protein